MLVWLTLNELNLKLQPLNSHTLDPLQIVVNLDRMLWEMARVALVVLRHTGVILPQVLLLATIAQAEL